MEHAWPSGQGAEPLKLVLPLLLVLLPSSSPSLPACLPAFEEGLKKGLWSEEDQGRPKGGFLPLDLKLPTSWLQAA